MKENIELYKRDYNHPSTYLWIDLDIRGIYLIYSNTLKYALVNLNLENRVSV